MKKLMAFAIVVAVFVLVVQTRPADFRVSRSAAMAASPGVVFAQVNDLHKWEAWSPWVKMDPNAKSTFEGPSAGVGAKMSWEGNSKVGSGSMQVTESHPNNFIRLKLIFRTPIPGTSTTEFTIKPEGNKTQVTWSMYGQNKFFGKAVSVFVNCDKMIGDQYEKGLAALKAVTESDRPM